MPTSGLLTQVLIAKYLDHLPLYRQNVSSERAQRCHPAFDCLQRNGSGNAAWRCSRWWMR